MVEDNKKKGLGRGLMSLFGDQDEKPSKNIGIVEKIDNSNSYFLASISDLSRSRFQPRNYFDEKKIDELSQSIKKMV